MSQRLVGGFIVVVLAVSISQTVLATGTQVPFDRVYAVAGPGSTTPINQFDINGPAPWVYLDLPSPGGQYSYGSSNWFAGASTTAQYQAYSPSIFSSEGEYWLSPPADAWAQIKSAGPWHVDASFGWWDLVIIYGAGAPVTKTFGNQRVDFSVMNTADANGDGRVDVSDLGALATNFDRPGGWSEGDFSRDGMVDVSDLGILATHWGDGTNGSGPSLEQAMSSLGIALPEPAIGAIAAGFMILVHRRSRKQT